jgi:hypothetical protein
VSCVSDKVLKNGAISANFWNRRCKSTILGHRRPCSSHVTHWTESVTSMFQNIVRLSLYECTVHITSTVRWYNNVRLRHTVIIASPSRSAVLEFFLIIHGHSYHCYSCQWARLFTSSTKRPIQPEVIWRSKYNFRNVVFLKILKLNMLL